jgi:N-acyl-D-glutamate deacylase
MRPYLLLFGIVAVIPLLPGAAAIDQAEGGYDLVLAGGRVIDPETGLDAVRNVGIRGGNIAVISAKPLEGKIGIDATGLIVAPGFIDLHAHGQTLPAARMQACDGVTTALELESGSLPIAKFYERSAREGRPIHYGASVSWGDARVHAFHPERVPEGRPGYFLAAFGLKEWSERIADEKQLKNILGQVEQGLKEGGIGIGICLGYAPGSGRKEYYELHRLAARYAVPTFTHTRFHSDLEPQSSFEAYEEMVAVAITTGAHVHICHFNSTSGHDIERCAILIRDAQKRGAKITVEAYPYGAGSTGLNAAFFRQPNWTTRMGIPYSSLTYLKTGEHLTRERLQELQLKDPSGIVILRYFDEENRPADQKMLDRSVLFPGGAIASDGMLWQVKGEILEGDVWPLPADAVAHPRSAGCFSRFLRLYVRQRKALTWPEALRKCTLVPAQILETSVPQMKKKGRVQVGADADLVVFDPEAIADCATFAKPVQTSAGIRYVVVSGTLVVRNGALIRSAHPGLPVRRTVVAAKQ